MVDILVIGSGGAGLSAALSAKKSGAYVLVVNKSYPTRAQTSMAQGGINGVLYEEDDTIKHHFDDTIKSAHGLSKPEIVEKMVQQAPKIIKWLDSIGTPFSRTNDKKIAQRRLGAVSYARACYSQDYTGLKILHTLYDQCLKEGIEFLNEHYLLNFVTEDNNIKGATFLDIRTSQIKAIEAKSVIVATGGYASVYHNFTTNTHGSSGDGIAAAVRAGARVSNIEFVQFHPTALNGSNILISESARGAGGYLLNHKFERFTDELAPRDKLAREIYEEIEKNKVVYLDIRHLGKDFIEESLPQERKLAKLYSGLDPVDDIIPIHPVAHYSMGGIEVDENSQSRVKGLFACGECANIGVHGANRLGGNSLLEILVFGEDAGKNATLFAKNIKSDFSIQNHPQFLNDTRFIDACFRFPNQIDFYEKREFLGKIFYRNAGIIREEMNLKGVLSVLRQIQKEYTFMGIADKTSTYNTNLVEFIEFGNMVEIAEIILVGAISRHESRGAHYRLDKPKEDDINFKENTIMWKEEGILCTNFD